MPTIKDIATMAGVSHGTVSNVLNGRGNVSAKKIKLVEDAAQKLGYQLNLQAKILKEGSAKTISVVLPNITSEQYSNLYDGLFSSLNLKGYELALYLTHDAKELELKFIQTIATKRDSAIIVVTCLDSAEDYYQTIKTDKNKIIFVYREPVDAEQFISLNFEQAGKDIADAIIRNGYHNIGVFTNSDKKSYSNLLKKGLIDQFKQLNYPFNLHKTESLPVESNYSLAFSFFAEQSEKLDAIVTSDIERAHYIRNANYFGSLNPCPPIYTLSNKNLFLEDSFYQYQMNYAMLSISIVDMIEGKSLVPLDNQGFLALPEKSPALDCNQTINFLILPSPSTEAVRKLLPHFKKVSGIDVNLIVKPFDEIYRLVSELEQHKDIDIIRIDMASLPWFARSSFKPLNELNIDLNEMLSHYSTEIIERFSYIHETVYAIPFDPSIQILFYRRDLFNDPLIKRLYFERYRQNLDIPTNFTEFGKVAEFFNQQLNCESPVEFGGCVTLGNTEIVASEFLLRYYAHGGKLIENEHIILNQDIALKTLQEFSQFNQIAKNLDASWWQESVKQFEQGHLAMLIVYMNLFSYISCKNILPLIGYTAVPGNTPLFGGGSLSMSKYSQKNAAVAEFFNWFFSEEISEQIALLGGSTARDNIFQNQQIMNSYPWFNIAHENYPNGIRENHLANGKCIDLRRVENIIGKHIKMWVKQAFSSEQTIELLNQELSQNSELLIH